MVSPRACARAKPTTMNTLIKLAKQTTTARKVQTLIALGACSFLSACYVVPINHSDDAYSGARHRAQAEAAPAAPVVKILNARLYPANDIAAPYGVQVGTVSSQLNGRGDISVVQAGEVFRGEATRDVNNSRNGVANGAGSKGGYMSCTYTMTQQTQGTGTCKFNNGAVYRFHIGD